MQKRELSIFDEELHISIPQYYSTETIAEVGCEEKKRFGSGE